MKKNYKIIKMRSINCRKFRLIQAFGTSGILSLSLLCFHGINYMNIQTNLVNPTLFVTVHYCTILAYKNYGVL